MPNWLPFQSNNSLSDIGKLVSETSVLGPFFRLSSFAEDDPQVVEKFRLDNVTNETMGETLSMISKQIHPLLTTNRVKLFQLLFAIILILNYLKHYNRMN